VQVFLGVISPSDALEADAAGYPPGSMPNGDEALAAMRASMQARGRAVGAMAGGGAGGSGASVVSGGDLSGRQTPRPVPGADASPSSASAGAAAADAVANALSGLALGGSGPAMHGESSQAALPTSSSSSGFAGPLSVPSVSLGSVRAGSATPPDGAGSPRSVGGASAGAYSSADAAPVVVAGGSKSNRSSGNWSGGIAAWSGGPVAPDTGIVRPVTPSSASHLLASR
jgi:hypothetical protein